MGLATFVFKMQLQSNEQLAISFKNLTANAEFKYLLSDENLSTSDTIVDKTNNSGVDLTSNLIIKNISNKKYLYMSFRCGLGQNSASVEDIQIEHNSVATEYETYVKDKIFVKNDNDVYEEFEEEKKLEITTGVEFETNETRNGKVVYGKIIDCGALPNNTTKSIAHNIANVYEIINYESIAVNPGGSTFKLNWLIYDVSSAHYCNIQISKTQINLRSNWDASSFNCTTTIYYTKN